MTERQVLSSTTSRQNNLGFMLATSLDPPDLARRWFTTAAEAGHTGAAVGLSRLQSEPVK